MPATDSAAEAQVLQGGFPNTLWTEVLRATGADSSRAAAALTRLCEAYRDPIVHWFRRAGLSPADAEDQAQRFLTKHFSGGRLKNFEPRPSSRFRSWLLTCLRRQLWDLRHPGRPAIEDISTMDPPASDSDGAAELDREVAQVVHCRALRAAESRWSPQRQTLFGQLVPFLLADPETGAYQRLAPRLGMRPSQVKRAVLDLRHDYSVAFHAEIRQICLPGDDEAEMRHLLPLVARPSPALS